MNPFVVEDRRFGFRPELDMHNADEVIKILKAVFVTLIGVRKPYGFSAAELEPFCLNDSERYPAEQKSPPRMGRAFT